MDMLAVVGGIAVPNGVDERFFDGQMDAENVLIAPPLAPQCPQQFIQKLLTGSADAGELGLGRPRRLVLIRHLPDLPDPAIKEKRWGII